MQAITQDNTIRARVAPYVLINGGSGGNLVPLHVLEALKSRIVEQKINCKMVDGGVVSFKGIAWLVVSVKGVSRVIAATVVDSVPGYSLLLGRH